MCNKLHINKYNLIFYNRKILEFEKKHLYTAGCSKQLETLYILFKFLINY